MDKEMRILFWFGRAKTAGAQVQVLIDWESYSEKIRGKQIKQELQEVLKFPIEIFWNLESRWSWPQNRPFQSFTSFMKFCVTQTFFCRKSPRCCSRGSHIKKYQNIEVWTRLYVYYVLCNKFCTVYLLYSCLSTPCVPWRLLVILFLYCVQCR